MDRGPTRNPDDLLNSALARGETGPREVVEALRAAGGEARARVRSLLELAEGAGPGTGRPREDSPGPGIVPGFVLEERLGVGASSVVYRARQLSPRREVAVKLLRAEALNSGALQRFEREAEILAGLQHPGIAQVHGTGFTTGDASPLPWIAMELVRGVSIDVHVQRTRPPAREIVALFGQVCEAVAHAHSRGIVHRDLKSSNLLVDEAGRVRVLDFGVARLVSQGAVSTLQGTRDGSVVGTLASMSPEQARGENDKVDARADVYALGVLLFELLCGRPPLRLEELDVVAALRAICEEDPPRLSSMRPDLPRDLDAIVAMCLEKDPARRYPDAAALGTELADFLAERPVRARPPTIAYQARKFVLRHRALSISTAVIVLALATGLSIALRGLRAEREQRERSSEMLDAVAGQFLEMSDRIGFGEDQRADLEALTGRIRGQLVRDPGNRALNAALADTLYALASLDQARDDFTLQLHRATEAREIHVGLLKRDVSDTHSWTSLSRLEAKLGEAWRDLGDSAGRDEHFERALEIDRRLAAEHPDDLELVEDLGWSLARVACAAADRGDHEREEALHFERLADAERLYARDPNQWKFAFGLSHAHYYAAAIHKRRDEREPLVLHGKKNVEYARRALELDPGRRDLACWLSDTLRVTAGQIGPIGFVDDAAGYLAEAMSIAEFVAIGDPLRFDHVRRVRLCATDFAELELSRGRPTEALRAATVLRRVAPIIQRFAGGEHVSWLLDSAEDIERRCAK